MRQAARGVLTLDDDPGAAAVHERAAHILHSLKVGLIHGEDVPYHWHAYVLAYHLGLKERVLDQSKKDEGGYTMGGPVASPSRANQILERMRLEAEQGARGE